MPHNGEFQPPPPYSLPPYPAPRASLPVEEPANWPLVTLARRSLAFMTGGGAEVLQQLPLLSDGVMAFFDHPPDRDIQMIQEDAPPPPGLASMFRVPPDNSFRAMLTTWTRWANHDDTIFTGVRVRRLTHAKKYVQGFQREYLLVELEALPRFGGPVTHLMIERDKDPRYINQQTVLALDTVTLLSPQDHEFYSSSPSLVKLQTRSWTIRESDPPPLGHLFAFLFLFNHLRPNYYPTSFNCRFLVEVISSVMENYRPTRRPESLPVSRCWKAARLLGVELWFEEQLEEDKHELQARFNAWRLALVGVFD